MMGMKMLADFCSELSSELLACLSGNKRETSWLPEKQEPYSGDAGDETE